MFLSENGARLQLMKTSRVRMNPVGPQSVSLLHRAVISTCQDGFYAVSWEPVSLYLQHGAHYSTIQIGLIARVRTLYHAKGFCDQFVRAKVVLLHVRFAVGIVLRKVSTADYAAMVAANTAANKIDAFIAA